MTRVCETVANSICFIYGPCVRVHDRVAYKPCWRSLHRHVHGQLHALYTAVCTVVYTAVYTGRVHVYTTVYTAVTPPCTRAMYTAVHGRQHGPVHGSVDGPASIAVYTCTRPCTQPYKHKGHVCGSVRAMYMAVTKQCTGREHAGYTAVYTCARPCTWPYMYTTRVRGRVRVRPALYAVWSVYVKQLSNRLIVTANRYNIEIFLYIWRPYCMTWRNVLSFDACSLSILLRISSIAVILSIRDTRDSIVIVVPVSGIAQH